MKMKNLITKLVLSLIIVVTSTASIYAQKSIDNKVLFTVGNDKVTVEEFVKVYKKNNQDVDLTDKEALDEYLNLYINFKLKVAEAEALMMDTSQSFIKELDGYRSQLAKPYFVDESVNEELLQEAYSHLQRDVRASHILIMVDENATPSDTLRAYEKIVEVLDNINAGNISFEDAAAKYSEDPSSRDREAIPGKQRFIPGNKGDLGYFTVFNMVYPFEKAAYETNVGEVSPIIRTKYGYHILNVTDNKEAMGKAEVAHVFVALRADATPEDAARKAEKAANIYAKINGGMSFEDAVNQYSEDKGSVRNQGKLSKFTCNRVVPEFVEAIDNLEVGEVSEPVKTAYGFHIIKLIDVEKPGSFDEESPKLTERLAKDQRSKKSKEAVITKVKKENKFKVYPKAVNEIIAAIDTSVLKKQFSADSLKSMSKRVMKLGKMSWSQYDFAEYVESNQRIRNNIDKEVLLNQMFIMFEDENCIAYLDSNLEKEYPEFKDLIKEYHDGILLFNLTDNLVWTKAVKDSVGLKSYFDKNRDNYKWKQRAVATIYKIKGSPNMDSVISIINSYDSDGDIAKALNSDSSYSARIIPDTFERGDDNYVDMVDWKTGLSAPIESDVEELTVLVNIRTILPPDRKELDDARGLVTADYQNFLEEKWVKELKSKYPVEIDEEVQEMIVSGSTK